MNKISFHSKGNTVFLLFSCTDGRLKYYTGEGPGSPKLNRIRNRIEEIYSQCKLANQQLTKQFLREQLDQYLHRKVINHDLLIPKMEFVIEQMRAGKIITPRKKIYEPKSLKSLAFTIKVISEFKPGILIRDLQNANLQSEFMHWCHKKKWSTNYIGNQIKQWKSICTHIPGCEAMKSFKKITEETSKIYLDEPEIKILFNYDCKESHLTIARDWFIIGCYTGLRVSDLLRLDKKNLAKGFITIANEKTDEKVIIPVHPMVKKILKRYGGFPPFMWEQDINDYIKRVAEKAGLDDTILFSITKGGKRHDEYFKKYQVITTHSGRRSFITNLRKNGIADSVIMKLAGIKSITTLKKYDLLTADEAAKIAASQSFFKE